MSSRLLWVPVLAFAIVLVVTGTSDGKTIIVDDDWEGADHNDISDALYSTEAGDILRVFNGTYDERDIDFRNSISLIGNGSDDTTIEMSIYNHVRIDEDNCTLSGFRISWHHPTITVLSEGIHVIGSGITISNCVLETPGTGVHYRSQCNNSNFSLRNCTIIGSSSHGIDIDADGATIIDCTVINSSLVGIDVDSYDTMISDCTVVNSSVAAVRTNGRASIRNCSFTDSGIELEDPSSMSSFVIDDCTLDGKPIVLIFDRSNVDVQDGLGQALIGRCTNVTVSDNTLSSLIAYSCVDLGIMNSSIDGGAIGTVFNGCEGVTISNSTFTGSEFDARFDGCTWIDVANCRFLSGNGIRIDGCDEVRIGGCVIEGGIGMDHYPDEPVPFSVTNCTMGGGAVLFLVNASDMSFTGDIGEATLIFCRNITLDSSNMTGGHGVSVIRSGDISISNCRISNAQGGIQVVSSSNTSISNCRISNAQGGIRIVSSSNISMTECWTNGTYYGFQVSSSTDVYVSRVSVNNVTGPSYYNYYGFRVEHSSGITIERSRSNARLYLYQNGRVDLRDSYFDPDSWYYWGYFHIGNGSIVNTTFVRLSSIVIYADDADISFDIVDAPGYYYSGITVHGNGNDISNINILNSTITRFSISGDSNLYRGSTHLNLTSGFSVSGNWNVIEDVVLDGLGSCSLGGNGCEYVNCSIRNAVTIYMLGSGNTFNGSTFSSSQGTMISGYDLDFNCCTFLGGMKIDGSSRSAYGSIDLDGCTLNGEPIVLIEDEIGPAVPDGDGPLFFVNCSDLEIRDLELNGTLNPILLAYCSNVTVARCTLSDGSTSSASVGLLVDGCDNVTISHVDVTGYNKGIVVEFSKNIIVEGCTIVDNVRGMDVRQSEWIDMTRCRFEDNSDTGLYVTDSRSVEVHFNDIIGHWNDELASVHGVATGSWWNNYWSTYQYDDGDGDGIGDIPYLIGGTKYDYSPLVRSFTGYDVEPGDNNDPPMIEIDDRTNDVVYFGNHLLVKLNVTEDRGKLREVEIRIDGGDWIEVHPDVQRLSLVEYTLIFRLRATDYSTGRHVLEVRVSDDVQCSEVVVSEFRVKDPYETEDGPGFSFDSYMVIENTLLFISALMIVFLLHRMGRRRRGRARTGRGRKRGEDDMDVPPKVKDEGPFGKETDRGPRTRKRVKVVRTHTPNGGPERLPSVRSPPENR